MKLMADKLVNQLSVVRHWLGKLLRSLKLPQPQKLKVSFVLSFCKRLFYYFRIWILMSKNSFMTVLSRKKILFLFLLGKILRFSFFTAFIYFLVLGAKGLSGYTKEQVVFFFLTFSLIDILSQFLFREVYRFRSLVVTGDLDLVLTKPVSTLFRVLMGGADVIDFITIPPLLFAVCYVGNLFQPSYLQIFLYILLFFDGFWKATYRHIQGTPKGYFNLYLSRGYNGFTSCKSVNGIGKSSGGLFVFDISCFNFFCFFKILELCTKEVYKCLKLKYRKELLDFQLIFLCGLDKIAFAGVYEA